MKIGVDVRELAGKKAGIGWYVFHVLKNILELDTKNNYTLYSDSEIDFPAHDNAAIKIIAKGGLGWHYAVTKEMLKDKIDLYWAPTSPIVPALTKVRTIMTIHDMTTFLFPGKHELKGRVINKLYLKKALKKTTKVLAISESTKRDLQKIFPVPDAKIAITYPGYDESFKPLPESEVKAARDKYKLDKEYILCVGTLEPRKNIGGLIESYNLLTDEVKEKYDLVLVGKKGWLYDEIFKRVADLKLQEYIKFLDYVDFADLPAIYNGAEIFVYPSLYEGFGLPPLEAMACGKAVITSNVSSLPEVVGDAAILIDPKNTISLADEIANLLNDLKKIIELEQKSLVQAQKFSWKKTAEKTLEAFKKAVSS